MQVKNNQLQQLIFEELYPDPECFLERLHNISHPKFGKVLYIKSSGQLTEISIFWALIKKIKGLFDYSNSQSNQESPHPIIITSEKKIEQDIDLSKFKEQTIFLMEPNHLEIDSKVNNTKKVKVKNSSGLTPLKITNINQSGLLTEVLKADLNTRIIYGYTLEQACIHGNKDDVDQFLINGIEIETKNSDGLTPLHIAADSDNLEVVKLLLERGADLLAKTNVEDTPLHSAAMNGFKGVVSYLLDKNKSILDMKNSFGNTPLFLAALYSEKDTVEYLTSQGADLNAKNNHGVSPLSIIISTPYCQIESDRKDIVEFLLNSGSEIETKDSLEQTPLHLAANFGYLEIVKLLVEKGANLFAKTNDEDTPLHAAAAKGFNEVVSYLLNKANSILDMKNSFGNTPLFLAALNSKKETVKYLTSQGADLNAKNNHGVSPLSVIISTPYCQIESDRKDIVEFLLNSGSEIEAKDSLEQTPLHLAAYFGYLEIVKLLVERGANLLAQTNQGDTSLHAAAIKGCNEVVSYLLDKDNTILELKNSVGRTPLCIAAMNGRKETIEYLSAKGGNFNVIDEQGNLPFILALMSGYKDLSDDLLKLTSLDHQDWLRHRLLNSCFNLDIEVKLREKEIPLYGSIQFIAFQNLFESITKNDQWITKGPPSWSPVDSRSIIEALETAKFLANLSVDKKIRTDRAIEVYNQNKLLILPSGITRHAITLAFLKQSMATGDRALEDDNTKGPHIYIREIGDNSKIESTLANLILDRLGHIESNYILEGVLEDLDAKQVLNTIKKKAQPAENCAETAARIGFQQGLTLYLGQKFLDEGHSLKYALTNAKKYASEMFKDWVEKHRVSSIQRYIREVDQKNPHKTYILACVYDHLYHKKKKKKYHREIMSLIKQASPGISGLSQQLILSKDKARNYKGISRIKRRKRFY